MKFTTIWRAWCEVEGNPNLPVPSYAKPRSLRQDNNTLWMELNPCPEVSALLQGKKFEQGPAFVGNFEGYVSQSGGVLKPLGNNYSIDETDLKEASFAAYYLPSPESKEAITLDVVQAITGNNQIVIHPGGKFEASRHLSGKTVKVQVTYPKTLIVLNEPVDTIHLHLVGILEDETIAYAGVMGCAIEVMGKLIKVTMPERMKVEVIS